MVTRVCYTATAIKPHRCVLASSGRNRVTYPSQQKNIFKHFYCSSKKPETFPLGMPSSPTLPGDADYHHFEHMALKNLNKTTDLSSDQLNKWSFRSPESPGEPGIPEDFPVGPAPSEALVPGDPGWRHFISNLESYNTQPPLSARDLHYGKEIDKLKRENTRIKETLKKLTETNKTLAQPCHLPLGDMPPQ